MKPSSSWTPVRTPIMSRWRYLGGFEVLPVGVWCLLDFALSSEPLPGSEVRRS